MPAIRTPVRALGALLALVIAPAGFAANPPAPAPAAAPAPTVANPQGRYQTAWLTLDGGDRPVRAFLALRDGRPVQFWSTEQALPGGPAPSGQPKLLVDALRGQSAAGKVDAEVDLRLVSTWAPQARLGTMTLALSLAAEGDKVTGTWTSKAGDKTATGR
ncbi:MAG TPA: hypothetical protein VF796_01390, partial [Humisphaera sp.]